MASINTIQKCLYDYDNDKEGGSNANANALLQVSQLELLPVMYVEQLSYLSKSDRNVPQ